MTSAASSNTTSAAGAPPSQAELQLGNQHPQYSGTEQHPREAPWKSSIDDPITLLTLCLVVATFGLWRATVRLAKDTVRSGKVQADKMEQSVAEAARAATAMEGVAKSMAINAEQVVKSVGISADIAKHQRLFGQMQMRAYLTVVVGKGFFQDANYVFQAEPRILNTGHTPARNVRWRMGSGILPVPLPDTHSFALDDAPPGGTIIGPGQDVFIKATPQKRIADARVAKIKLGIKHALFVWGVVSYEDVFGVTRRTTFAQQIYWEMVIGPDGKLREPPGCLYLQKHNRCS